jgi:hypothetical protein
MATGSPGTNGVWQYGEDDSEATFSALLNKAASTTDTAIGVDRGRLTTLEARALSGFVPISPSSIVIASGSGSANALGQVSFTGATAVSLNSVFTTAYRNYKIVLNVNTFSATTNLTLRLRNAGTDIATNNHFQGGLVARANGTGAFNIAAANDTRFYINYSSSGYPSNSEISVFAPHLSQLTSVISQGNGFETSQVSLVSMAGQSSSVADGFTIFTSAGTMAGLVQVFGYND